MNNQQIASKSFIHSLGVVAYIALVAAIISNGDNLFGAIQGILGVMAFLLLFSISAATVGLLVFGRPVYMFMNDQKPEALRFLGFTLGFLVAEAVVFFIIVIAIS